MTRDESNDTIPAPTSLETTEPGVQPEFARDDLPASPERERMEQLIHAFNRPPQRPSPNYAERAHSDGGAAVVYSATTRPSPAAREEDPRNRLLFELAELARRAHGAPAPVSNIARDITTKRPAREVRAQRRVWIAAGGVVALAIVGIAAVCAGTTTVVAPSSVSSRAAGPNAVQTTEQSAMAPAEPPQAGPGSTLPTAHAASATPPPAVASSRPAQAAPDGTGRVAGHWLPPAMGPLVAPQPSAKPANDPTIDELDRAQ